MPSRPILIALAALAATFLVLVAVANSPSNMEREFKSEAAEGVAPAGPLTRKPHDDIPQTGSIGPTSALTSRGHVGSCLIELHCL